MLDSRAGGPGFDFHPVSNFPHYVLFNSGTLLLFSLPRRPFYELFATSRRWTAAFLLSEPFNAFALMQRRVEASFRWWLFKASLCTLALQRQLCAQRHLLHLWPYPCNFVVHRTVQGCGRRCRSVLVLPLK